MKITLSRGYFALIDDEDYPLIADSTWHVGAGGRYAMRGISDYTRTSAMHRVIMGLGHHRNDRRQVDHINGDTLDNRRSNLRICNHQQNQWNRHRPVISGTGFRGVSVDGKKFAARIKINGRTIRLGKFATPEEAHAAYCEKLKSTAGEFAEISGGSTFRSTLENASELLQLQVIDSNVSFGAPGEIRTPDLLIRS